VSLNSRHDNINDSFDFIPQDSQEAAHLGSAFNDRAGCMGNNQHKIPIKIAYHIFRRGTVKNERNDFCAIFEWPEVNLEFVERPLGDVISDACSIERTDSNLEQTVFVNVVKFPEHPEQRREFWMRAIVRLYRLDRCPHVKTQRTNPPFGVMKLTSITSQREGELVGISGHSIPGLMDGDGVNQVIEGSPQIVDAIPKLERQGTEVRSFVGMENPTMTGTIGIQLLGDAVILRLQPGRGFSVDGIQVMLGAPEFGVDAR
jgi:hypothetical protein